MSPDETPDETSPEPDTTDVPPANPGYATPPPEGIPDAEHD